MVNAPWEPEHVVSTKDARRLIRGQIPELAVDTIEPFGVGWDNIVYLVDRTWVFRFPRRQIAVDLVRTEARVLPRIAPELPLPVPVPVWIGSRTAATRGRFSGYRLLPGRTACIASLDARQRVAAAEGVIGHADRLRRLIEGSRPRPPVTDGRVVHGDLYARHLLVDDLALPAV